MRQDTLHFRPTILRNIFTSFQDPQRPTGSEGGELFRSIQAARVEGKAVEVWEGGEGEEGGEGVAVQHQLAAEQQHV